MNLVVVQFVVYVSCIVCLIRWSTTLKLCHLLAARGEDMMTAENEYFF